MSGAPSGREEAEHAGEGVGGAEARGKMAAGLSRPEQARSDFADFSNFGFADFLSSDFTTIKKVRPSVIIFTVSHGPSNK